MTEGPQGSRGSTATHLLHPGADEPHHDGPDRFHELWEDVLAGFFEEDDFLEEDGALEEGPQVPDPIVGGPPDGYNVEVVFTSAVDEALLPAFEDAVELLGEIVTADVITAILPDGEAVDDLRIEASVIAIDGPGTVLGGANPLATRDLNGLPATGFMEFDEADAAQLLEDDEWDDVVLHEMLHVVGVGTVWDALGLLETIGGTLRFTGENAIAAYAEAFPEVAADDPFSDRGVPVEEEGGPGTALSHWDEELFGSELMTGFLGDDPVFTDLTLASIEDVGYETVWEGPAAIA